MIALMIELKDSRKFWGSSLVPAFPAPQEAELTRTGRQVRLRWACGIKGFSQKVAHLKSDRERPPWPVLLLVL